MNPFLLSGAAALLLLAPLAHAQTPAPPKTTPLPTPPPRPQLTDEHQLLHSGSFDKPPVTGRSPAATVKNLLRFTHGEWIFFGLAPEAFNTGLEIGLTNEAARTGKQAVYVAFEHVKRASAFVQLATSQVRVKPEETYHVALWGRMDAQKPIILDQRVPLLRLQVDFFQADGATQTGDPIFKVQPIPGTPNRPLFFTADRWTEYWNDAKAPADAQFIRVTWLVGTSTLEGETNGVIYLDDLGITGERPPPVPAGPVDPDAPVPALEPPGAPPLPEGL